MTEIGQGSQLEPIQITSCVGIQFQAKVPSSRNDHTWLITRIALGA